MADLHKLSIPTEQGYNQLFNFKKEDLFEFKKLLTNMGTQHIGNYSLRVENHTLSLYKKNNAFNGPCYVMDRDDAIQ